MRREHWFKGNGLEALEGKALLQKGTPSLRKATCRQLGDDDCGGDDDCFYDDDCDHRTVMMICL